LTIAAWRLIRYDPMMATASSDRHWIGRVSPALRWTVASLAFVGLLAAPAVVHMRRDRLAISPVYGEDAVLYTQADEYHNLSSELYRRGRPTEAAAVQEQSDLLAARGKKAFDVLVRAQPAREFVRTPEDYVDASLDDYNNGDFQQCVYDATESLRLRPGMPAAWNNISICNSELGEWDAAIAAANEALRIEPESEVVRESLDEAIAGKRRAVSGK
jgi:tetratricopeptide (TPR) repeat protein